MIYMDFNLSKKIVKLSSHRIALIVLPILIPILLSFLITGTASTEEYELDDGEIIPED